MKRFFNAKKEAVLQWITDRRVKKSLKTEFVPYVEQRLAKNPSAVFLVLTPEHGNLGDHAIAYAEATMLREMQIEYIEITEKKLWQLQKHNYLSIMNGHPILINGGGNLGTLWIGVEYIQREIMRCNPRSPIFVLPNTIFYEDSDWGRDEWEKSIKLYNAHEQLYLYAREKQSFGVMKEAYRCVKLVPDMVLSLNMCQGDTERSGCALCLRDDCEKTRTDAEETVLMEQVTTMFGENWHHSDMRLDHAVCVEERSGELEKKFDDFRKSQLVITDRLHGMIFCAVTGTPCVVINSKSPKIKGCYEWVKDLGYIVFVDDVSQIQNAYESIEKKNYVYDQARLQDCYAELKQDILQVCRKGE